MHVLYRVTYIPHESSNVNPKYYVGSKYNYARKYYGSPSSVQQDWYTSGKSIAEWWKIEVKRNPRNFRFEILESYDNITPTKLVEKEYDLHIQLNVKTDEYFNRAYATRGWVSAKRSYDSKKKSSSSLRAYWSGEHLERRAEMRLMNATTKPDLMKALWKSGRFDHIAHNGRPKGAKDKKPRLKNERKVIIDGIVYPSAQEAAAKFSIDPVNVRRRCRMSKYTNWQYL